MTGGILSVDDTVIQKIYSNPKRAELISYSLSIKPYETIIGLSLTTLYYTEVNGTSLPINYQIYDKKKGKTKNYYLRQIVIRMINWGVKPKIVTGDSWYSAVENLKFLKKHNMGFLFGIQKNRTGSNEPRYYCPASTLVITESVFITHLKEF